MELNFENIYFISSMSGSGTGEVLDDVANLITVEAEEEDKALPKIFRLLTLIREEFVIEDDKNNVTENKNISHARTSQLLRRSKGNWAKDIIADREDRV